MNNTALPITRRPIFVWGTTLIVAAAAAITAIGAHVVHQRSEVERLRADVQLIDAATAQLAFR
jgi:hypothetical protein